MFLEVAPSGYPPRTATRQTLEAGLYRASRVLPCACLRPGSRRPSFVPKTRLPGNIAMLVLVPVVQQVEMEYGEKNILVLLCTLYLVRHAYQV